MERPIQVTDVLGALAGLRGPLHLAIGMFDGVHAGHRRVLGSAVDAAAREGGSAAVLTFSGHPSRLLRPDSAVPQLLDPDEKLRRLALAGIDGVARLAFTPAFAALDARGFVDFLVGSLPALAGVHVGENFRYGRGREGDAPRLVADLAARGLRGVAVGRLEAGGEAVSSTRLRGLVAAGRIGEANALLGDLPYGGLGTVVPGRALGRTIGVPTLNLDWDPELRPPTGVYVARLGAAGTPRAVPAIANFGLRPTVAAGDTRPVLELHALAPVAFGPGDRLGFDLLDFLRPERRFPHLEALKEQVASDIALARARLGLSPCHGAPAGP